MTHEWTDNQGRVNTPNPNAQTGLVSGGKPPTPEDQRVAPEWDQIDTIGVLPVNPNTRGAVPPGDRKLFDHNVAARLDLFQF